MPDVITRDRDKAYKMSQNFRLFFSFSDFSKYKLYIFFSLAMIMPISAEKVAAQDSVAAGLRSWRIAGCASCHGTFGEGGGGGEQPEGPSLRKTILDARAIKETVRCGRPGSKMPFFLRGGYTNFSCWDTPTQATPPDFVTGPGSLSPEAIDFLVEYLMARVVNKGDVISKADCGAYFGDINHSACSVYP